MAASPKPNTVNCVRERRERSANALRRTDEEYASTNQNKTLTEKPTHKESCCEFAAETSLRLPRLRTDDQRHFYVCINRVEALTVNEPAVQTERIRWGVTSLKALGAKVMFEYCGILVCWDMSNSLSKGATASRLR